MLFHIVSIDGFHYPAHIGRALARQDIRRLLHTGVDGFQIDAACEDLSEKGGGACDE